MKRKRFLDGSMGKGIKFLTAYISTAVICFSFLLTFCKNKEPQPLPVDIESTKKDVKITPVVQELIISIEQNPKDWSTKEVEQKYVIGYDIIEYWINKKCDIKIKVGYSFLGTYVKLISPDTLDIRESEIDILVSTYYKYVRDPQQLIKDSIDRIELHKKTIRDNQIYAKKEAEILNKLCK